MFSAERIRVDSGAAVDLVDLAGAEPSTAFAAAREGVELLAVAERIRAEALRRLAVADVAFVPAARGYASSQRWLVRESGVGDADAAGLVMVMRLIGRYEATAKALGADEITIAQVELLARAERQARSAFVRDEHDLLRLAIDVDEVDFGRRVSAWLSTQLSADPVESGSAARHARRRIAMQPDFEGGGTLNGYLDASGFGTVWDALETGPDPVDSLVAPRSLAQRRADALVDMAAEHLGLAPEPADGAAPDTSADAPFSPEPTGRSAFTLPVVDVIVDLASLEGERPSEVAAIRSEYFGGFPLPKSDLEQLLCDARYRRVLVDGDSVVLDYGKAHAEIPTSLRRVVQLRDRHCQFPGCDRSWQWCDVHHLRPKSQGGHDDHTNLALVCRFHHNAIHKLGWQMWRDGPTQAICVEMPEPRCNGPDP